VAVDVREFRSSLPSILHQQGMRLAPVTLYVGDFVLSPVHCIERKSISDLFGSFNSGRLFSQAQSMTKYYKCPCLLIEFHPSKSFRLLNAAELTGEIKTDCIISKISLLVMHFPKLRLLWSRGPHETFKIFKTLKENHQEVNVEDAMLIGSNESLDLDSSISAETFDQNEDAKDMILRLPGITKQNSTKILNHCQSIAHLSKMPREELKELIGPMSGQKLFTFLRQTF